MTPMAGSRVAGSRPVDVAMSSAAAQVTLERTEIIIEDLAQKIKQRVPRVHHVTLEAEGIAPAPAEGM